MGDVTPGWLGWRLVAAGVAIVTAPVRRHRAVWHVTVGGRPLQSRVLSGGEYMPAARVTLDAIRNGERRPDAELPLVFGVALICSGLALNLIRRVGREVIG